LTLHEGVSCTILAKVKGEEIHRIFPVTWYLKLLCTRKIEFSPTQLHYFGIKDRMSQPFTEPFLQLCYHFNSIFCCHLSFGSVYGYLSLTEKLGFRDISISCRDRPSVSTMEYLQILLLTRTRYQGQYKLQKSPSQEIINPPRNCKPERRYIKWPRRIHKEHHEAEIIGYESTYNQNTQVRKQQRCCFFSVFHYNSN
jgi:hypothetical protein